MHSAQLGKGTIQVPKRCPHQSTEAAGRRWAGGTLCSCLKQCGPGQQCGRRAPGKDPQHMGAREMAHAAHKCRAVGQGRPHYTGTP